MDDLDKGILELLQSGDFCIPQNTKIAGKLGKPISTVRERIRRLEGDSVLKYTPLLDFSKLGWKTLSVIAIKVQQKADVQKMVDELKQIEGVQEVYWAEGEWNLYIKVRTRDEKGLQELEASKLLNIDGIREFRVARISKILGEGMGLPF